MSNKGGFREGSGAKKGQHRVHVKELRDALENRLGISWQEHQANINTQLYSDFKQNKNVKEFLMFNETMNRRILAEQIHEVEIIDNLSKDEIDERINNLQTRLVLSAHTAIIERPEEE